MESTELNVSKEWQPRLHTVVLEATMANGITNKRALRLLARVHQPRVDMNVGQKLKGPVRPMLATLHTVTDKFDSETDVPPPREHSSAGAEHANQEQQFETAENWPHLDPDFQRESLEERPTGYPLHHEPSERTTDRHALGHGPRIGRRIASEFYNIHHQDWHRRAIARFAL